MNVLVIGGGSIGQRHVGNLKQTDGVEVCVCTRNPLVGSKLNIKTYTDLEDAWTSRPAAVVVANSTSRHLPAALAAAERGCHLLIEKPLSHTDKDIGTLKSIQNQRNLTVMIGCNMRFHPALKAIKRALGDELIGKVLTAEAHCGSYLPDWRPGRDYRASYSSRDDQGGGAFLDLIHELDYLYWFFGDVEAVASFSGKRSTLEIDSEDTADMLLRFTSGLVAQVHLDYVQRTPTRGCRIAGQDGTLVWNDEEGKVTLLRPAHKEQVLWAKPAGYDKNDMYAQEIRHFLSCVQTGTAPLIGLEEGEAVLRIALAAKAAARAGRVIRT